MRQQSPVIRIRAKPAPASQGLADVHGKSHEIGFRCKAKIACASPVGGEGFVQASNTFDRRFRSGNSTTTTACHGFSAEASPEEVPTAFPLFDIVARFSFDDRTSL